MKKILFLITLTSLLSICFQQKASALGVGLYGGFSYSDLELDKIFSSNEYNQLSYWLGGGLVFDTAVAKKKLFNYRLNLGLGMVTQTDTDQSYDDGIEGFQLELINSFGFGIVKVPFMRMWLGPQVGVRFAYIDPEDYPDRYQLSLLPGAVLGFNFNIGSFFTIGIDGGFRYSLGRQFRTYYFIFHKIYNVTGPEGFVNLSIIFRINDEYGGKKSRNRDRSDDYSSTRETTSNTSEKAKGEKISEDKDYWFEE